MEQKRFEPHQDVWFAGGRNTFKFKFGCYALESGKCILLYNGGHVVARLDAVSSKSPEEIELEEAKKKQIDDLMMDYLGIYTSSDETELRDLFSDMQKSSKLAKIILPLKGDK